MAYVPNKTWLDLEVEASRFRGLLSNLDNLNATYKIWQVFRDGRTNAQIAADLGGSTTELMVAELDACMSTAIHVQDYIDNTTPVSGTDHGFAIRKFASG